MSYIFSKVSPDTIVPLCSRWKKGTATVGQTAIKIPPTGPKGHHKGLFDIAVSYSRDKGLVWDWDPLHYNTGGFKKVLKGCAASLKDQASICLHYQTL